MLERSFNRGSILGFPSSLSPTESLSSPTPCLACNRAKINSRSPKADARARALNPVEPNTGEPRECWISRSLAQIS